MGQWLYNTQRRAFSSEKKKKNSKGISLSEILKFSESDLFLAHRCYSAAYYIAGVAELG